MKLFNRKHSKVDPQKKTDIYIQNGRIPWSEGYVEFKWERIQEVLHSMKILEMFSNNTIVDFEIGIDERIVEYPWILSQLSDSKVKLLDAGSTFNFLDILQLEKIKNKELSIQTFYPESNCFFNKRISYVYEDLRNIPFKDAYFQEIVCQSTLEHIDMDNSMYGYSLQDTPITTKSYEYLRVIHELERVLQSNGLLLLTFPYGKFENHGFFQQFDSEMVDRIIEYLNVKGTIELTFFKYFITGWACTKKEECDDAISYNPHTGIGKGIDNAAHSRAICCVKFIKN